MEKWVRFHPNYEVSDMGNVRSLPHVDHRGRPWPGKTLKPFYTGKRRNYLCVNVDGETLKVHRLVATSFLPMERGKDQVNHKDGDKRNNCLSNLEWCTRGENIAHAYKNSLRSATGTDNSRCLTDEATVREICLLLQKGYSCASIRDLGYKYGLVRKIKDKSNWKHISDEYF